MQNLDAVPESPIPLSYRTPEPRKSRARFWIAGAIILVLIVAGFLGIRWNLAARSEARALSAARQQAKQSQVSHAQPDAVRVR